MCLCGSGEEVSSSSLDTPFPQKRTRLERNGGGRGLGEREGQEEVIRRGKKKGLEEGGPQ